MKTWKQHCEEYARQTAAECGCTLAEALECAQNDWPAWRDAAEAWIRGGATPTQAWVNAARETNHEWWDRRICHDMPDAFDRMARAGLSLFKTKVEFNAGWPK